MVVRDSTQNRTAFSGPPPTIHECPKSRGAGHAPPPAELAAATAQHMVGGRAAGAGLAVVAASRLPLPAGATCPASCASMVLRGIPDCERVVLTFFKNSRDSLSVYTTDLYEPI